MPPGRQILLSRNDSPWQQSCICSSGSSSLENHESLRIGHRHLHAVRKAGQVFPRPGVPKVHPPVLRIRGEVSAVRGESTRPVTPTDPSQPQPGPAPSGSGIPASSAIPSSKRRNPTIAATRQTVLLTIPSPLRCGATALPPPAARLVPQFPRSYNHSRLWPLISLLAKEASSTSSPCFLNRMSLGGGR